MPSSESTPKSQSIKPSAQNIAVRQQRLQRGIAALHVALDSLPLTGQQRLLVQSIIREQEQLLAAAASEKHVAPKSKPTQRKSTPVTAKSPKQPISREEQQRRALEGQLKKQKRAERDKKLRLIEAKQRAEVEAVHRKSGYSSFMRRMPGSFEGGKK